MDGARRCAAIASARALANCLDRVGDRRPPQVLAWLRPSVSDTGVRACAVPVGRAGTIFALRPSSRREAPRPRHRPRRDAMPAIGSRSGRERTKCRRCARLTVGITLVTMCSLAGVGQADGKQKFCSETARTLFAACKAGVADDTL